MSYPKDIDEYTDFELQIEMETRKNRRAAGLCDYCNRPPETPACKFPARHALGSSSPPRGTP